jgi:hypothetical protein
VFEDDTARTGLAVATRTLTGWGIGLYDFDNDGFKDVFYTANARIFLLLSKPSARQ